MEVGIQPEEKEQDRHRYDIKMEKLRRKRNKWFGSSS